MKISSRKRERERERERKSQKKENRKTKVYSIARRKYKTAWLKEEEEEREEISTKYDDDDDDDDCRNDAFLRALAHSKSVDKQARLLDEMIRSLFFNKGVKVDDEDQALFLDLRPREKYQNAILCRAPVNIPFSEISGSFHLLPPREVPFSVLLDEEERRDRRRSSKSV